MLVTRRGLRCPSSGVQRCCQRKFEIHWSRRKLTEHLQGPRAALGAVGKEGIEKTKVAACRRQGLLPRRKTHQPTWNRWTTKHAGRESQVGCKRQVVGGCHLWAVLGRPLWEPPGRQGASMLLDGGHTPCGTGHMPKPGAGASRAREEAGRTSKGHVARPPASPGLEDWMTTPVPTRQAPGHTALLVSRMTLWEVVSQSLLQQHPGRAQREDVKSQLVSKSQPVPISAPSNPRNQW